MIRVPRPRRPLRGFTLLEMMIVLAVLAVLTAIAWPAVRGLLAKSELQNAAKQVRNALVRARLEAMETGTIRRFRYQPGGGQFDVAILARLDAPQESPLEQTSETTSGEKIVLEDALPDGVAFAGLDEFDELLALLSPEDAADSDWSEPVLFYPNGRTSNAKIRIAGHRGQTIEVALRGMTGTTFVGAIQQPVDELDLLGLEDSESESSATEDIETGNMEEIAPADPLDLDPTEALE